MSDFHALGNRVTTFDGFETFPCPPGVREVTLTSDEVTAVCPVTGQPDFYTVTITYVPDARCLESKTLKLYLQSFRNVGIFCEAFAAQICHDVFEATQAKSCAVEVVQKPRGGVSIRAHAEVAR